MSFKQGEEARRTIHVFLSYSTHDLEIARTLRRRLEGIGATVFLAADSIRAGQALTPEIRAAITRSAVFVALWSEHACGSAWVRHEIGMADGKLKHTILFVVGSSSTVPDPVRGVKYIDASGDLERGTEELLGEVAAVFAGRRQAVEDRNFTGLLLLAFALAGATIMSSSKPK